MARKSIKWLYYIAHRDNLPSLLTHGILSHELVEKQQLPYTPIYDTDIVSRRSTKQTPDGRTLCSFANLYFQARNPMLYRVIHEKGKEDIVILAIRPEVLNKQDGYVTDGNAASAPSQFFALPDGMQEIHQMWAILESEYWKDEDGSKRKIMAECLIPDQIEPEYIGTIYVASHKIAQTVQQAVPSSDLPIVPEPQIFFQPIRRVPITEKLVLVEGDMFFSKAQTLTISVNTVGVMGKGLASRTKYQFPDVYVEYQDACRGPKRRLKMGKPYLYKRESLLDYELADDSSTLTHVNAGKWFLLFPTKRHWREQSDRQGIEEGLQWLLANYQQEDIESLAVPALGCGLGGLEWEDVGPIMARYLSAMDIQVFIYLPREKEIPDRFLSREFLLKEAA